MKWQEKGIGAPEQVVAATEEYRLEEDFSAFLADKCIAELKAVAYAGMLFQVYEQWCEDKGEENPESESVGSQQQRHYQSRKEECSSQLPRQ